MPASIIFNQPGKPAGTPGKARDDFDLLSEVTCTNSTTETSYTWTLVDVPIRSALSRGLTSTNFQFKFTPDVKGTYLVKLRVNGSALVSDNAVSFAAVTSSSLGWRYLAAGEEKIDNINRPGLGFPGNANVRGWATERDLQLEDTEAAVYAVNTAVVTTPGVVPTNFLVRMNGSTGLIDPSLLPPVASGQPGIKYNLVAGDNITVNTDYQYLVSGVFTVGSGAVFTLSPGAQLVVI